MRAAALSLVVGALLTVSLAVTGSAQQGQPQNIGFKPVALDPTYTFDTAEQPKIRVVVVAKGLVHPFSVAVLPNGDALVAERGAQLRLVRNAGGRDARPATLDAKPVAGVPQTTPAARGFGLHDIALHPQFATNRLVYFTYNKAGEVNSTDPRARRPGALAIARGRFDGGALTDVKDIFTGEFGSTSGSRLAFAPDGTIYVTTGGVTGDIAQNPDSIYGKVLRLNEDGTAPATNPFVGKANMKPHVFSLGHRDQLGLTVHPVTGTVLAAEHGPNGGDEVNLILPGRNYGWPKFSYGRTYEGPRVSSTPLAEGIEQPLLLWLPSIAPTGLTFYTGDRFPAWKGNLFIGSARRGEIPGTGGLERVVLNAQLEELRRETLLTSLHHRVRDVRQGPDGLLYVVTDEDDGALLRIEPAQ